MIGRRKKGKMSARQVIDERKRCLGHYVDGNGKSRPCTQNQNHRGNCR